VKRIRPAEAVFDRQAPSDFNCLVGEAHLDEPSPVVVHVSQLGMEISLSNFVRLEFTGQLGGDFDHPE
jgi:hypothetical protein